MLNSIKSSFELQMFVLFAVAYHLAKSNDFDFVGTVFWISSGACSEIEKLLSSVDFNIHFGFPSDQLASEFLNLYLSTEGFCGPIHILRQTLDLIISQGLSVSLFEISETVISDPFTVIFESSATYQLVGCCCALLASNYHLCYSWMVFCCFDSYRFVFQTYFVKLIFLPLANLLALWFWMKLMLSV